MQRSISFRSASTSSDAAAQRVDARARRASSSAATAAQRGDLGAQCLELRRLRSGASSSRRPSMRRAGGLGVARQLVEPAAVAARLVALDGDGGQLLAQGVGLALHVLDALERGGQLGAGGLGLARALALEPVERLGELGAGGLRGLLVLGSHAARAGRSGRPGGRRWRPRGRARSRPAGRRPRRAPRRRGGRPRRRPPRTGAAPRRRRSRDGRRLRRRTRRAGARARSRRPASSARAASATSSARLRSSVACSASSRARSSAVEPGEQLALVEAAGPRRRPARAGPRRAGPAPRARRPRRGARRSGAPPRAGREGRARRARARRCAPSPTAGARPRRRASSSSAIELPWIAWVDGGQALLDVGVGSARAASRRASSASTHGVGLSGRKTTSVPAVRQPSQGWGSRLERLAQRAHHDGVLRAHALEHEVHRELEAEILEEEREVEALVELDRHEDRLDRERRAVGLERRRPPRGRTPAGRRRPRGSAARTLRRPARATGSAWRRTTGRGPQSRAARTAAQPARTTWRPTPGRP